MCEWGIENVACLTFAVHKVQILPLRHFVNRYFLVVSIS